MNKRIRKKKRKQKQAQKPDLQTAWNVVVEHLKQDGDHTYFIDALSSGGEYDIHCVSPYRTIVKSTLKSD